MRTRTYTASENHSGFTLIELLISVSIIAIIIGIGLSSYSNYDKRQRVRQAALTVKNNLRFIQTKALSAKRPAGCDQLNGFDVTFAAGTYTANPNCATAFSSPEVYTLPSPITFTGLPTPNPILFKVVNAGTNVAASTQVEITGFGISYTLTLDANGNIGCSGGSGLKCF